VAGAFAAAHIQHRIIEGHRRARENIQSGPAE
jgi:hypothetical protein